MSNTPLSMPPGPLLTRVILPFTIVALSGGSTWTAIRYQIGADIDMFWSMGLRGILGALAMICWAGFVRVPIRLSGRALGYAALIGALQFFLNFLLIYEAEKHITSGVVAMFFALLIVPNAILGRIFLKLPIGREFVIGSIVAVTGMSVLFAHEIVAVGKSGAGEAMVGIGLTLTALTFASAANIAQASDYARSLPSIAVLVWAMTIGAVAAVVLGIARSGLPEVSILPPSYWLSTVYLGLIGSALTFPLYFALIRQIGPARAAYSGVAVPIVAMILSTLLEDYRWSGPAMLGSTLALGGLIIALRARKPA